LYFIIVLKNAVTDILSLRKKCAKNTRQTCTKSLKKLKSQVQMRAVHPRSDHAGYTCNVEITCPNGLV